MSYKDILIKAYNITTKQPAYWLFGLVLLGGFNLYLINFSALFNARQWRSWPWLLPGMGGSRPASYFALLLGSLTLFVVINLVKIIFIVVVHKHIHKQQEKKCDLCFVTEDRHLPYVTWLINVLIASGITIAITTGLALMTNTILNSYSLNQPAVVMVNVIIISIAACIAGCWNLFTSYFIVMHKMKFADSASSAIDLLVSRPKQVAEFLLLLSAIYSVSVLIGNFFIDVWNNDFTNLNSSVVRIASLFAFIVWFAINNTFFHLAMMMFFDKLVKAKPVAEEVVDGQLEPNILN